jgi:hypothetical protein
MALGRARASGHSLHIRTAHVYVPQITASKVRPCGFHTLHLGAIEVAIPKYGSPNIGSAKINSPAIGIGEVHAATIRRPQIRVL